VDLSQQELQRIKVTENAVEGRISVAEAAKLLGLSERQVKRLKRRYQSKAAHWVYHGNRGKQPANRVSETVRKQVVELAEGPYKGFNDTHYWEKLKKLEAVALSRQSVQRILREAGLPSPQTRRAPKYRSRRERRAQEGMMLQTDGSTHDWLEQRGPKLTLLGFIDDATGKVPGARFQAEAEDTAGYLRITREVVEKVGIPLSIYRDQHGTFQRNDAHWSEAEQLAGSQALTQLGRCWQELGITSIPARSPQAKGRVERLWRTFQDRLVSELRLAGARTVEQANDVLERFLPEYHEQFSQPARQTALAYRKLDARLDLDYIFALRYPRVVNPDHTIVVGAGLRVQLPALPGHQGYAGKSVEVCQQPNGDVKVYLERRLLHQEAAEPGAGPVRARPMRRRAGPRKKKPLKTYTFAGRAAI
jgi:transposase